MSARTRSESYFANEGGVEQRGKGAEIRRGQGCSSVAPCCRNSHGYKQAVRGYLLGFLLAVWFGWRALFWLLPLSFSFGVRKIASSAVFLDR